MKRVNAHSRHYYDFHWDMMGGVDTRGDGIASIVHRIDVIASIVDIIMIGRIRQTSRTYGHEA